MRNDFPQITKGKELRIPHSGFQIPVLPQTLQKNGGQYVHVPPSSPSSSLGQNHSHMENSD